MEDQDRETRIDEDVEGHANKARNLGKDEETSDDVEGHMNKHSHKASHKLAAVTLDVITEGQRAGDVREGPVEQIGLPIFSTLHGFAGLAVSGVLPYGSVESGLDDVIAYVLRGCAPDA